MIISEEEYLEHYGTPRHSGRYPWGSGGNDSTSSKRNMSFLDYVSQMKAKGLADDDIRVGLGMSTTQWRALKSIAKNEKRQHDIDTAQKLKDKGWSNVAIGEKMGINESSVRSLLAPGVKDRADVLMTVSSMLKQQVDEKKYVDIGTGVELHLGISETKLKTAVAMLQEQGYEVHTVQVDQLGTKSGNKTLVKVLAPPGTTYRDIAMNTGDIKQIQNFSDDGGRTMFGIDPPVQVKSSRVAINYAEDGGSKADGVIYVRPGVKDLSMGQSRYAQVRIAVDGTHYLKGMAMYKDDLPDGVDLVFNTNKSSTGNKKDAMKKLTDDPDNPFGSVVRQLKDPKTGKVNSAMNIVNEEGNWDDWSKNLSSQFLSKQSSKLAKAQLNAAFQIRKDELDEIMSLTNPAVRKKLLESFADGADSSAVHLKAAALPRQRTKVILPVDKLKENEVYAPTFRNGERVVLVRHPHGGTFEIPELVVNNSNPSAKRLLGDAADAIGIHSKVAERLSGADFDGDTVLVIPNDSNKVKTSPALEGLKDFDAKRSYPKYDGMTVMDARTKGHQMGDISNLITDMTIRGANHAELARAVRHSMVVIDAEKHELNWKQSAIDNGIADLKRKYQGGAAKGASTLVSKAGSRKDVLARKRTYTIDPATGKKVFQETGESYVDKKTGKTVFRTQQVKKLEDTDDAHSLSSGTTIEKVYADHSNRMKALANSARKEAVATKGIPQSSSAKKAYADEVKTLDAKLNLALRNRPLERQAQIIGNATLHAKRAANPDMDATELKKVKYLALKEARDRTGAGKTHISLTDREWQAIQAGAISNNKLKDILNNSDLDVIKKLATPRAALVMTSSKVAKAKLLLANGHTQAEVADALGVALSTLKLSVEGG